MRRLPPLSSLRAFEAAARHGSFKKAASELGVTPTAISHQIRGLEEYTGLVLFDRKVRKVSLTDAGARLYPAIREGFDGFERIFRSMLPPASRTKVTISATNAFTARWIVPRVSKFHALHPEIDLQLLASDEPLDLSENRVDIAIRYGDGPYPGLKAEPLFGDDFAPLASPALAVSSVSDLERVPLIHFEWKTKSPRNPTWERWFEEAGRAMPSFGQLRFNDESHAVQAALAGQGLALLSRRLLAHEIATGQLVQPFGPIIKGRVYHLLTADGSIATGSEGLSAAIDWLRAEATAASNPPFDVQAD